MASGGKKKTTMAKLNRESKLRERRAAKQAKKNARKLAPATDPDAANLEAAGDSAPTGAVELAEPTVPQEESTPESRPPADDVTTEKAIKHLFPDEAREAVSVEAQSGHPEHG